MTERLQKILSRFGVASRRAAEELIARGRVCVNGQTAVPGQSADAERDCITVDGKALGARPPAVYIMLNKPRGYVCTLSDERGRRTAAELVRDCGERVFPVGRLDMDSEGLLLLTNDGELANRLMHPSHEAGKTYRVTLAEPADARQLEVLRAPMLIDGYRTRGAEVVQEGPGVILVTIHEGRKRQVRLMCARAGNRVVRLVRVAEAGLELGELEPGKWRYLTEEELERLRSF